MKIRHKKAYSRKFKPRERIFRTLQNTKTHIKIPINTPDRETTYRTGKVLLLLSVNHNITSHIIPFYPVFHCLTNQPLSLLVHCCHLSTLNKSQSSLFYFSKDTVVLVITYNALEQGNNRSLVSSPKFHSHEQPSEQPICQLYPSFVGGHK